MSFSTARQVQPRKRPHRGHRRERRGAHHGCTPPSLRLGSRPLDILFAVHRLTLRRDPRPAVSPPR
eukprot:3508348-Pyramimonas_sp.AAC.1